MKNKIRINWGVLTLLGLGFFLVFSGLRAEDGNVSEVQCPSGHEYLCYEVPWNGLRFEFRKGEGDTIIIRDTE